MKMLRQSLKRMRPFMGTFVEIEIFGLENSQLAGCIEKGFQEIALVENLMSRFRDTSEVSRFNRLEINESMTVSQEVLSVLKFSNELREISHGDFDIALGSGEIFSVRENTITRIAPGLIDLGGIAKGHAVDRAVEVLESCGASGIVNAGGDLRVFGGESEEILLKETCENGPRFYPVKIKNIAVATSNLRSNKEGHFELLPPSVQKTVSVFANTCIIADALTKIVLYSNQQIVNLCLSRYNAEVFIP